MISYRAASTGLVIDDDLAGYSLLIHLLLISYGLDRYRWFFFRQYDARLGNLHRYVPDLDTAYRLLR